MGINNPNRRKAAGQQQNYCSRKNILSVFHTRFYFFQSSPKDMFVLFSETGRERQHTDVREKHRSVASCILPDRGSNL